MSELLKKTAVTATIDAADTVEEDEQELMYVLAELNKNLKKFHGDLMSFLDAIE